MELGLNKGRCIWYFSGMKIKLFISLSLGLLLLGVFGFSKIEDQSTDSPQEKTVLASPFSEKSLRARTVQGDPFLLSQYKDRYLIVDFWATWCPPCVAEIPHFIAIQEAFSDVQVLGISVDDDPAIVEKFIKSKGINYPIIMSSQLDMSTFGPINSIPTTFVLDKQNRILKKVVGYESQSFFEAVIAADRKTTNKNGTH